MPSPTALAVLFALAPLPAPSGGEVGFRDFEIYELSSGASGLTAADLDGDGRGDLAVLDNARSRIEVLLRLAPDAPAPDVEPPDPNEPVHDRRFLRLHHPVERRLWRLAALDLDGDGRPELAYAEGGGRIGALDLEPGGDGEPPRLVPLAERRVDALREGTLHLAGLDADGDGRESLLAAGPSALVELELAGDAWSAPRELDRVGEGLEHVTPADVDGDGRLDLLAFHDEVPRPLRVRLQGEDGAYGPRQDLDLPPLRSAALGDLDGDGRIDVAGVLQLSGRVAGFAFEDEARPRFERFSLGAGDLRARDARTFGAGDLDGDGAVDLVVARADVSRVTLLLGRPGSSPVRREFSSLVGVRDPRVGRLDDRGPALVVFSGPERVFGLSRLEGGELPFPETRAAEGEPVAGDVADFDGDGYDDALALVTDGEGRRRETSLQVWAGGPDGPADAPRVLPLEGLDRAPEALRVADLDRDGDADVAVFPGGREVPRLYFQEDGELVRDERGEDAPGLGILAGAGRGRLAALDADGDGDAEVLVAAESFARALLFRAEEGGARRHPEVLGQWAGPSADAEVRAATAGDLDGDGRPELALWDATSGDLVVLRGPAGAAEELARVEAADLEPRELLVADVDADGRGELVVFGGAEVGLLDLEDPGISLRELGSVAAEPGEERYAGLLLADLDRRPGPEVVVGEQVENALAVLGTRPGAWEQLLGFRVFEEKSFSGGANTREPRELIAHDLDGDGRDDLALLVHDKLILYLQD